jgi:hypothetical protein
LNENVQTLAKFKEDAHKMGLFLKEKKINPLNDLLVSYGVSKYNLYYYGRILINGKTYSTNFPKAISPVLSY